MPAIELDHSEDEIRVLVTAFGPWDKHSVNPSDLIVSALPGSLPPSPPSSSEPNPRPRIRLIAHHPIRVAYDPIPKLVPHLIETHRPDLVLHLGLDDGRKTYNVEQSATRPRDTGADVDGERWTVGRSDALWPGGETEENGGATARFGERIISTFDVKEVQRRSGVVDGAEVVPSDSVGTYLCAFIFWTTLAWYHLQKTGGAKPVLFVHVPSCPTEQDVDKGVQVTIELIKSMVSIWLESKDRR